MTGLCKSTSEMLLQLRFLFQLLVQFCSNETLVLQRREELCAS